MADKPGAGRKRHYHHGDLRQALIDATRALVEERGAEHFTLSDACRRAGVSTAAPYRHFRDKQEILANITAEGFDRLSERFMAAVRGIEGSPEAIVAMGQTYVAFAVAQPAIFRLMFGQDPALKESEDVSRCGESCFGRLIEQVQLFCHNQGIEEDAGLISLQLWTFVHGAASLLIDGDYAKVTEQLDVDAMVRDAGLRILNRR